MTSIITPSSLKTLSFQPTLDSLHHGIEDTVGSSSLRDTFTQMDLCPTPKQSHPGTPIERKLMEPSLHPKAPFLENLVPLGPSIHDEDAIDTIAEEICDNCGTQTDTFENYIKSLKGHWSAENSRQNVHALVQEVLRESYLLQCDQLTDYANKVKGFNAQKKAIREELNRARTMTFDKEGQATSEPILAQDTANVGKRRAAIAAQPVLNEAAANGAVSPHILEMANPLLTAPLLASVTGPAPKQFVGDELDTQGHGMGAGISGDGTRIINETADEAYAAFQSYWLDLTPEEQSALESHIRAAGGLNFRYWGREVDLVSDDIYGIGARKKDIPVKLGAHESISDYVRDAVDQMAKGMILDYKNHNDGLWCGEADVGKHYIKVLIPSFQYSASPVQPAGDSLPPQTRQGLKSTANGGFSTNRSSEQQPGWEPGAAIETQEQCDDYIKALEDRLNSVGDDAQLANVDLQNCLQKQQQLISLMSNISKTLHETAMSIIRKMGS